jgi:hypothetical protein
MTNNIIRRIKVCTIITMHVMGMMTAMQIVIDRAK